MEATPAVTTEPDAALSLPDTTANALGPGVEEARATPNNTMQMSADTTVADVKRPGALGLTTLPHVQSNSISGPATILAFA